MIEELRALAVELAIGAGNVILEVGSGDRSVKSSPTDLVTAADHAAEKYIFDRLTKHRPDDTIIAEEGSSRTGTSGVSWVVDPLDGTINFVYGIPQWCVSIGIEGEVRAGVIHDPVKGETFTDADAFSPSSTTELSQSLIGTGFAYSSTTRKRQAEILNEVLPNVRDIRRAGSCALDLAWVANGRLDGFFEQGPSRWDVSAGLTLIESAGGSFHQRGDLTIAAGNETLLAKLMDVVLQADRG